MNDEDTNYIYFYNNKFDYSNTKSWMIIMHHEDDDTPSARFVVADFCHVCIVRSASP